MSVSVPSIRLLSGAVAAGSLLTALPAQAQLPDPVREMIDAAIASGDPDKVAVMLDLARQTNPDDVAEINTIADSFADQQAELAAKEAAAKEEKIRSAGLFDNWSGEGQIGAFRTSGNTKDTGVTVGLHLQRTGIKWRHKLTALTDYQRSSGNTTREQYLFSYEPNYQINERLYAYALGQYERDKFQGYTSRIAASGGLGYIAIDEKDMFLAVKGGPAWRKTSFVDGGSSSDIAALAALDFDWQITDTIKFTEDATAFIQSGNKTFTSDTGIEAQIGDSLSARFAYIVAYDTDPPLGVVKTDTTTRMTLIYGF